MGDTYMSAVTPPSSSRFLRSFNRFWARSVFARRVSVLKKVVEIVSRPYEFADKHIKEGMPNAFFDSIKFYLKLFALTFILLAIADHFSFSEEISEIRQLLIRLVPQLACGTLVLFLLLRLTRNRIPFDGLLQTVLYVDAVYLLFDALLTIPILYLNYVLHAPTGTREVDLLTTEFEGCLSTDSFAFWLIRGDVQFFVYDDKWQGWIEALIDNRRYITAVPFLILFALIMRRKYGSNFLIATIAASIAFVSANEAFDWVEGKARTAIANTTNCESTYVRTALDKFSADRIARQLQFKLSNSLEKSFPSVNQSFWLEGNDYILGFKIDSMNQTFRVKGADYIVGFNPELVQSAQVASRQWSYELFFRSTYCSSHPYWVAVRGIKYNLAAFVFHQDRTLVSLKLKPEDCWSPPIR